MAYTSGTLGTASGDLLSILDVDLVANDKWSVYDASAGTNAKVYRCYDSGESCDYYVYVDDNHSGSYAIIELWEGWDDSGHAGTGDSLTLIDGQEPRVYLDSGGGYGLCVSDHRFIFLNLTDYAGYYAGQVERFDTSKNMPILIACELDQENPLGHYHSGTPAGWGCLWDEDGTNGTTLNPVYKEQTKLYRKTIAGSYWVQPTAVYNNDTDKILGTLEGVGGYGYSLNNGLNNGDKISISGVDWVALGKGDSWCFVRQS